MVAKLLQFAVLLLLSVQAGNRAGEGHLLVTSYGTLLAIQPDGRQTVLAEQAN